jgi:two-component system, sensor histidine kinase and response regulator
VLSKPVKESDLLEAIAGAFRTRQPKARAERARPRRATAGASPPLRILAAEDNATNQTLVTAVFEQRHDRVVIAHNGQEAVDLSSREPFDLILMDVQMPVMSGLEATAAIRQRERATGHHVPIIAMTAHAMSGDRERCLQAGMDGYVAKPLRPDELLAVVDGLLGRDGASPEPVRRSVAAAAARPTVNESTLLAGFGGNRKVLGEVIDMFLTDGPELMATLRKALHIEDRTAIASSAHAIKGSVGLFVQTGVFDTARQLERSAKAGEVGALAPLYAALERGMHSLGDELRTFRRQLD